MYDRILVPFDASATARRGLQEAVALARRLGSSLQVLHVVELPPPVGDIVAAPPAEALVAARTAEGERLVAAAVAEARANGCSAEGHVRCDTDLAVADIVLREAQACDASLIVMGTHGRGGMRRLAFGSDAEAVLRASPVPVLLVRLPSAG